MNGQGKSPLPVSVWREAAEGQPCRSQLGFFTLPRQQVDRLDRLILASMPEVRCLKRFVVQVF